VVLDSVTQLVRNGGPDPARGVLSRLVLRVKQLGATSVLTLEVPVFGELDEATQNDLSLVADNLVVLRYVEAEGLLAPTLTVVKTRGSAHDRGRHPLSFERGGLSVCRPRPGAEADPP
jgi:circadian clock protein KaiC